MADRRRILSAWRSALLAVALVCIPSGSTLSAQEPGSDPWVQRIGSFAPLLADPLEPRFAVGLVASDVFAPGKPQVEGLEFDSPEPGRSDIHGTAMLGGRVPLWGGTSGNGTSLLIGAQAGVLARFRMSTPQKHNIGADWMVALPVELARDRSELRLRLLHRSSHLGDDLIENTGASRIDFGHEAVDLLVGYRPGRFVRLYGGGAFFFRSNTAATEPMLDLQRRDRFGLQAGAEAAWRPWSRGAISLLAGVDAQSAERTAWDPAVSLVGGLTARGSASSLQLLLRYFRGPSPMHQFFLTNETFWGVELKAEI